MARLVGQALGKHDLDRNGVLGLPEWVRLLTKKPWCSLLHPETQFLLDLHDAPRAVEPPPSRDRDRVPSPKQKALTASERTQALLAAAKKLFRRHVRAPSQGLREASLGDMYRAAVADNIVKGEAKAVDAAVARAFQQCDVNEDGEIAFGEFLRLLTRRPWRSMLPAAAQGALDVDSPPGPAAVASAVTPG